MITLNGNPIEVTIFPDGTSQVWKIAEFVDADENLVVWDFDRRESELFHLKQLKALIDHLTVKCKSKLVMPYLPYARQDRDINDQETFALTVFADEINSQKWDLVQAFDTHNAWGTKIVMHNFQNLRPNLDFSDDYDIIIFPDAGAAKRYPVGGSGVIVGNKVRDPATGYITSYKIDAAQVKGKKVLVIDDLCDGGMTFKILGKELGEAAQADLYVSHGLFSKGLLDLMEIYGKIITTDSMTHLKNWDKSDFTTRRYVTQMPRSQRDAVENRFEVIKLDIRHKEQTNAN